MRANLTSFLTPRDNRFREICSFIKHKTTDIPHEITRCNNLYDGVHRGRLLKAHLSREIIDIIDDTNRFVSRKLKDHAKFDDFRIERLSTYHMVQEWMQSPLGLSVEVWVALQNFECPNCKTQSLVLNGGSTAAWCDLYCTKCPDVYIEVKCRYDMDRVISRQSIPAGSFRWLKAQQKRGIEHYIFIVPKQGGVIKCFNIRSVHPRVDGKFCAFYNYEPDMCSLKTYVNLSGMRDIGVVNKATMKTIETISRAFTKRYIHILFSSYARRIQRCWKRLDLASTRN